MRWMGLQPQLYDLELVAYTYEDGEWVAIFRKKGLTGEQVIAVVVGEYPEKWIGWRVTKHVAEER